MRILSCLRELLTGHSGSHTWLESYIREADEVYRSHPIYSSDVFENNPREESDEILTEVDFFDEVGKLISRFAALQEENRRLNDEIRSLRSERKVNRSDSPEEPNNQQIYGP